MKNACTPFAIAVSTVLAAFALTASAHADEPAPAPDSSEAPLASTPVAEPAASGAKATEPHEVAAPANPAQVPFVAPPPLVPTRVRYWTPPPAPLAEPGPSDPTLGAWGIVTAALGASAMTAGLVLLSAKEEGGGVPSLLVGGTATVAGLVMIGVGYSSPSTEQEASAQGERSARVTPTVPEPSWEVRQATRQSRREVGMGLTITGVLTGVGAVALFAASAAEGGCGIFDGGAGYCVGGGATVLVTGALLGVGIPLWAANSRDLPRPPVHAELGLGPGSIELRGGF